MGQKRGRDEQQAQLLYAKRIEVVKSVKAQLANPSSVASQTVSAYSDLFEDVLKDVVLDVHRGVHTGQIDLEDTVTDRNTLPAWVRQPKQTKSSKTTDAFGQLVANAGHKEVVCACCGRSVAASRNGSRKARRKGEAAE